MSDAPNSLIGRLREALGTSYTVEAEIGRGGMGVVFQARDERLKRQVAVKVLPPELAFRDEIRTRFLREAETAARLSHPHIVPIFSVGEGPDGLVYFIMAFIDGEPLSAKLQRRGRLPPEEARRILCEVSDALGAAHAVGIVHRDVKPDNILLEGSRGRVVVTDFGIAKALSSTTGPGTLTATGVAIGTPQYMSPEQAAGDREIDGRSDIYSLGVVGYQMLVGELPFHAPTVPGILMKHITEPAPLVSAKRPDCPDDLAACVMRCLEKEPDQRWPTAESLERALEARSTPAWRPAARPTVARAPRATGAAAAGVAPPHRNAPAPAAGRALERQGRARRRDLREAAATGEPVIVVSTRRSFVKWASVSAGLMVVNLMTAGKLDWSLFVVGVWGAFRVIPDFFRLWQAGYSWRDVFERPSAPDAVGARAGGGRGAKGALKPATAEEFGAEAPTMDQLNRDRAAIADILAKLPASERQMLPDVQETVDALGKRAENLARMLHTMSIGAEDESADRIDERIAEVRRQPESGERDRQLGLLERQRSAVRDLAARRQTVREQLESCVLAMQNVRFDLLRLRSAGVAAVLGDLTQATQQARALSRDVDHAIDAAAEVKDILRA